MIKKLIIAGKGGQGIKFLSTALSKILTELNYKISLTLNYDGPIRGGDIYSNLIYSDKEIENPIIEEADLLILASNVQEKFKAKEIIADSRLEIEGAKKIPFFEDFKKQFNDDKMTNMAILGFLLKKLDLKNYSLKGNLKGSDEMINFGQDLHNKYFL